VADASDRVFSIAAGHPFIETLAAGIEVRYGLDPEVLAALTVFLPTRRACRALRDAFLRRKDGAPLLLPRLVPLGDVDAEELALSAEDVPAVAGTADLPPALPGLRRQLLLAQAILRVPDAVATRAQALRLAAELARLLDEMQTQQLSFAALETLVPDDYAEHWRITLDFLKVLHEVWPAMLAAEGALDAADRRNRVLDLQIRLWAATPAAGSVIAAGSTGSVPATAALIAAVARLPQGAVVLPGVDADLDNAAWDVLDDSHPQYNLRRLLTRLDVDRRRLAPWFDAAPAGVPAKRAAARRHLLSETMRPAATTDAWRDLGALPQAAIDGLLRIDCAAPEEEAGVIALMLRGVLETPGRTAALVTPDRKLARRVAALMTRWGVDINDTAGTLLGATPVGGFLRLSAACAASRCAPVPLLALCKHPLAAGGERPAVFRALTRSLEWQVLRGPKPGNGLEGMIDALAQQAAVGRLSPQRQETLRGFVDAIAAGMRPFADLMQGEAPLVDLLRAHIAWIEHLAASDTTSGAERLWRHEDGEAAAGLLSDLLRAAEDFPTVTGGEYPAVLETVLDTATVRPRYGLHARLSIYGPLEARLIHADRMILGGLNEGTWPPEPTVDPWLSRPMRQQISLPAPEHRVGLSAHDFVQLAAQGEVILTRSRRVDGTPTVPSRWLSRLDTVLKAGGLDPLLGVGSGRSWQLWQMRLDDPGPVRPRPRPQPCPPVAVRPRQLSVSDVELLRRDPYALYARRILRLRALDPIAADPGVAERGQFIHLALDRFVRSLGDGGMPADALDHLLGIGREAFGSYLANPDVWAFWWPRFERIAGWFVAEEQRRRPMTRTVATEIKGQFDLPEVSERFLLTAIADRIDRHGDGSLEIIDYKTGRVPSAKEVDVGMAPQLPLEAVIAEAGGFGAAATGRVSALSYWRLTGGTPPAEIKSPSRAELRSLIEQARSGLTALVVAYDDPERVYEARPVPQFVPRYSDYEHLERVQEWTAGEHEA